MRGIILNMVKMFFSSTSLGSVTNLSRLDLLLYLNGILWIGINGIFLFKSFTKPRIVAALWRLLYSSSLELLPSPADRKQA